MKDRKKKASKSEYFDLWNHFDYQELDHMDRLDWLTLRTRTVLFNGEVTEELCDWATKSLLVLGSMSKEPITIIINTIGGSHFDGMLVIDTIEELKANGIEVITEVRGSAYSMGLDVCVAGSTRVANKYSRFLLHEVSDAIGDMKTSNIQEYAKEVQDVNEMLARRMAANSECTLTEIHELMDRKDYFFSAAEAKRLGFIDKIRRIKKR